MSKEIIMLDANRERINNWIADAQGKARERLINYDDIVAACEEIDKKLNITQKAKNGIMADVDINAQNFPRAYKYRAESTQFRLIYKSGKWRLYSVFRTYTRTSGHKIILTLTDAAREAIINNYQTW